ncbi:MAG: polymer-forming cytoskeletal protein [Myxococcota bacterium]
MGSIGKSIVIKGELSGNEDVEIDGTVEGDLRLPEHVLTIGPNGQVSGTVHAKTVHVVGRIKGDVEASERFEIEASGIVEGDIRAPRLIVQEGAVVNGSIEMTGGPSAKATSARPPAPSEEKGQAKATIQAV